jgi:thiol-disulfide isomerase/thioredoxin
MTLVPALAVLLLAGPGCGRSPAPSDPYLDLVAQDPHGRTLRFADFAGKVRVVDLWASWCGPCRITIPELNALHERYRERGLVVLGISVDEDPAAVLEFERSVPIRYPTGLFNPRLAEALGQPEAIPTTLLIDRRGALRRTFVGYVDVATLEEEIRGLL